MINQFYSHLLCWFVLVFFEGDGFGPKLHLVVIFLDDYPFQPILVILLGVILPYMAASGFCSHQRSIVEKFGAGGHALGFVASNELVGVLRCQLYHFSFYLFNLPQRRLQPILVFYEAVLELEDNLLNIFYGIVRIISPFITKRSK